MNIVWFHFVDPPGPTFPLESFRWPAYLPYGESFVVFGGKNLTDWLGDAFLYDPESDQGWTKVADIQARI